MKKYTILSSDGESSDKNSNINPKKSANNALSKLIDNAADTLQPSEGSKANLGSNFSSQKKNSNVESLPWDPIRTPSVKSDAEISYWITTYKAPCLYHYDKYIMHSSSLMSATESFENQFNDFHVLAVNDHSPVKKTCILDGKSYEVPTYIPSNKYSNTHCKYSSYQFDYKLGFDKSKSSLTNAEVEDLSESHKECGGQSSYLKRISEENAHQGIKSKITKYSQPLDDYDSGSSVLTASYIKYVNSKQADNMKQSKLRRKYLSNNSSSHSTNHFKHSDTVEKDSGCVLDKDSKGNDSSIRPTLKPLCEKGISRRKKLYNMDNILKTSFEETKRVNMSVFDNSKTSSSSVENSFNNESRFFKSSSRGSMQSADKSNKFKSEECSFNQDYSNFSLPKTSQMIITKLETIQYISNSYPSNGQNNIPNTYSNVNTEQIYKMTQSCMYNNF